MRKRLAVRLAVAWLGLATALTAQPAPDPRLRQIEGLIRQSRFGAAEQALRALPSRDPEADYLLGFTLIQLYRFAEAEEALARAVARQPRRDAWLHALAKARQEQGKNLAAIEVLDRAIAISDQADYRFAKAMCALNIGELEVAERELRRAIQGRPDHAEAHYKLGKILVDRGDYAAAAPPLEAALRHQPQHLEARFLLGLAASRTGDLATARSAFDTVLAQVPGHVGALYNSGRVLIQLGLRAEGQARLERFAAMSALSDRIDFTMRAVKKNPRSLPGRLELATLLLEAGRTEEALQELIAARPLKLDHSPTYRLLAEAFRRLGRAEDAVRAEAFAARLEAAGR